MEWLTKLFGTPCAHEWKETARRNTYWHVYIVMICQKCGKIKKIKL